MTVSRGRLSDPDGHGPSCAKILPTAARGYGGRAAASKTSRRSWLRIVCGLVGLVLALPVLAWSVAAILPSHNALTFVSSVLVGSLAVPALATAVIALVLALLARGGLRVVAVLFSVLALIVPTAATATTTWITDRVGGEINVFSAAAVSSMADHPDETIRYGSGPDETAQIYRPRHHNAPVLVDIHGGGMVINLAYDVASGTLTSSCGPVRAPKSVLALYPTVDVAAVQSVTTLGAGNAATKYTGGTPEQFPDRYRAVNSSTWITAKAPPTMVIQGNHDTFVPPSSVRDFVARARQAGVDITHVQLPMLNHAFDAQARDSLGFQAVTSLGQTFLSEHQ